MSAGAIHNSLHFFSFLQQKEINFLLIEWNQRIRELFDWIWLKDIITVLSYIGWPVLNNKSMKENLFGWNWFIWAVAGYGRPQAISSSFFSLLSALPNGRKEEKKSAAADAAWGSSTSLSTIQSNQLHALLIWWSWKEELRNLIWFHCFVFSLIGGLWAVAPPMAPPREENKDKSNGIK